MNDADLQAYKSMASIFELKVSSSLKLYEAELKGQSITQMENDVSMTVSQTVDQVLRGAEIRDRFEQNGAYFSLAVLDKYKASNLLRSQIAKIDSELEFLMQQGHKSSFPKALMLFEKRNRLEARNTVLTSISTPSKYTSQDVLNLRYANKSLNKVKITFNEQTPLTLRAKLEEVLLGSGFEVTATDAINYKLEVSFEANPEYLKVEGFEKYRFSLRASSFDNLGEKVGGFVVSQVGQGRNKSDAFLKVRPRLQTEFKNNFQKLNLK